MTPVSPTPYIRNISSTHTGLFPAKAGPTKSNAFSQLEWPQPGSR